MDVAEAPPLRPDAPARGGLAAFLASPVTHACVLAFAAALVLTWRCAQPMTGDAVRYADVALRMLETGDWVHPSHAGEAYFQKPPAMFWLAAASMRLLGVSPAVASLPSILAGIGVVLATWAITRRFGGALAGFLAGGSLLVLPSFVRTTGTLRMDSLLLLTAVTSLVASEKARAKPAWFAATWALVGLGVIDKGTPGFYPLIVLALASIVSRDPYPFSRRAFWLGGLVFLAVVAPWYVQMTASHGAVFWHDHLGREVGDRIDVTDAGATLRFVWSSMHFLGLLLPLAVLGAVLAWRDAKERPGMRRAILLALVWLLGVLAGQAINAKGFPRHVYSAMAAAAGLSGYALAALLRRFVRVEGLVAVTTVAGLLWLGVRVAHVPRVGVPAKTPQEVVLDAVERESHGETLMVVALRAHEGSDFLHFQLDRPSYRVDPADLPAALAKPRAERLLVLVDEYGLGVAQREGGKAIAVAPVFSLVAFEPRP